MEKSSVNWISADFGTEKINELLKLLEMGSTWLKMKKTSKPKTGFWKIPLAKYLCKYLMTTHNQRYQLIHLRIYRVQYIFFFAELCLNLNCMSRV